MRPKTKAKRKAPAPKPKARKPAKKPAPSEVQRLKKELRKLKVLNDFLGKNAAEFGRKALAAEGLLRVIVPNARRWIETALQGPEPGRERLLQWNLTESGILAAEQIIGRLQVARAPTIPPPPVVAAPTAVEPVKDE